MPFQTYTQKQKDIDPKWRIIDADGQVLGRLASNVANVLRGKDKVAFTPHMDGGDFVVVINAEKIRLTGNKLEGKKYYTFSGYRGGLKSFTAGERLEKEPEEVIREAIKGMLPRGPLGRKIIEKLKVYRGSAHPHEAQKPSVMTLEA